MMNILTEGLKKPFPVIESSKDKLLISLGSGLVVVGILVSIKPFGITSHKGIFLFLCGFGIIDFMITALNLFLLLLVIPRFMNHSNWTTGKNFLVILWILLNISIVNYFYGNHFIEVDTAQSLNGKGMIPWFTMTFSLGVIPVVFALYYIEKRLFTKNFNIAENLNGETKVKSALDPKQQVQLKSSKYTSLIISSADLICVKAEGGNYVSIFWHEESGVKKDMIRMTLTSFLEKTKQMDSLVRCHKSYIINLEKVISFHGNARSVITKVDGLDFDVPVSRSFSREKFVRHI